MSTFDELSALKPGDRVMLYASYGRGGPVDAEVVKVGRTLITVKGKYGRPEQFRLESGNLNNRDYPHHAYIKTPQRAAEDDYRQEVERRLHQLGIRLDVGGRRLSTKAMLSLIKVLEEEDAEQA